MLRLSVNSLFRLAIVAWIMLIYLIATGNLHWYLWLFVGVIIIDRVWVTVMLWLETQMVKAAAQRMIQQLQESDNDPFGELRGRLGHGPDIP